MTDESFETLFEFCVLEVLTPDTSISFLEDVAIDDWLASVQTPRSSRRQAFFDEQLNLLLVMHIKHPSFSDTHDSPHPPPSLVNLLTHIQVSLEATYIPPTPNQDAPDITNMDALHTSMSKGHPQLHHPSIFPPSTPNPIPSTAESDRKYVQSEGTLLFASIWGSKPATEGSKEKFSLLFSKTQRSWVAIYELSLIVSYLRLPFSEPLLCLTASITLRDKAISLSQSTHPLVAYLVKMDAISHLDSGAGAGADSEDEGDEEPQDTGFEEINLLEGLTLGSSVSPEHDSLHLPSTRIGNTTRQRHFSLPPVSAPRRTPSISRQAPRHILRKSYRKVLQTVSGFRVRMRTVFIPHVLLPKDSASEINKGPYDNDFENGNGELEAGNSERTVVLCVEVENSGESGPATGFSLERLDVEISGEGATTRLIGWGDGAFSSDVESHLFPLLIGSMEQYNLLYVVSFWNTPNDQENLLVGQGVHGGSELQRAVMITVYGRPYLTNETKDDNTLSYPTPTFSSKWNCVLDLSSRPTEEPADEIPTVGRSAFPEPPSPFPGRIALSSFLPSSAPTKHIPQAMAGKRHTLPGSITAARAINPPSNLRLSLPREYPRGSATPPIPGTNFTPPSVALQAFNRSGPGGHMSQLETFVTTPTPVLLPGTATNAPRAQPTISQHSYSSLGVETMQERGAGFTAVVPQTPRPSMSNTQFAHEPRQDLHPGSSGEPVVISVGLLPAESGDEHPLGQRKIFPSDQFTLDIFVYNQSSWTRRFEVSYPNVDRRQRKTERNQTVPGSRAKRSRIEDLKASIAPPGILPLQNRVTVGPLKASTCQSVRMDFLAISPGVHSVDILTITDVESGYAVNLRSVMDIVVHEHIVEEKEARVS